MPDWKKSEYKKSIGIKPSQLDWIRKNKGKKSMAGYLNYIIEIFKKKYDKTTNN